MQSSPNAIAQAGNLFVFTMNNPVRWIDPTGLSAQPIGSYLPMPGVQYIRWVPRGSTLQPRPPITVTRDGNNVTINAYVRFTGTGVDSTIHNSNITHRQAAVDGIINHWGGYRGGLNVNVNITVVNSSNRGRLARNLQRYLTIEIRDDFGTSYRQQPAGGWSTTDPGIVVLYTGFASGRPRTVQDVEWTSAHEFGHALGVGDGWGFGRAGRGWEETELGHISSIMIQRNQTATRLDLELVIWAHHTNTYQRWYNNPLIDIYGISR